MKSVVVSTFATAPDLAAEDVINELKSKLPSPDVLIVTTAGWLEPQLVVAAIHEAFACPLIGYSTNGMASRGQESLSDFPGLDSSVVVVGISAENQNIRFETGIIRNLSEQIQSGKTLLTTEQEPALCLLFPDGLTASTTDVLQNIQHSLGNTPIVGGVPADEWEFKRTYQFFGNEVLTDSAVYLLIHGQVTYSIGTGEGWIPCDNTYTITKSVGRTVYQIDNQSAYELYSKVVGHKSLFGEFPLQINLQNSYVLRAPLASNTKEGSIQFGADVPEGSQVRFTSTNRHSILEGSKHSILTANQTFEGNPALTLVLSCAARRQHLGARVIEETNAILANATSPVAFSYLYGEIAPLEASGPSLPLNETIVTLVLGTPHAQ